MSWSVVCLSVHPISQKFSYHGPLQNFMKEFNSVKNSGCHGNKTSKFLNFLKIFLSETIRLTDSKFGMYLYLMGLYQVSSNYSPGVKFYIRFYWENFRILPVRSHKA